jgi:hypothetical protein
MFPNLLKSQILQYYCINYVVKVIVIFTFFNFFFFAGKQTLIADMNKLRNIIIR